MHAAVSSCKRQGHVLPQALEAALPCQPFDFKVVAPRIVRQLMPVVLSHLACGTFLWQFQGNNTWAISHCFMYVHEFMCVLCLGGSG